MIQQMWFHRDRGLEVTSQELRAFRSCCPLHVSSSVFLSLAYAAARQKVVKEVQVIEYAGPVAHFYKLKNKYQPTVVFTLFI